MNNNQKIQNMDLKFDLFKLQQFEDKYPRTWICARGKNLNSILREIILKNCDGSYLSFARKIGESLNIKHKSIYENILKIVNQKDLWISFPLLQYLINLERIDKFRIYQDIEYLRMNNSSTKPVKAVKELNETFCKLAGAHAADGHIGKRYRVDIIDHYQYAVKCYAKWTCDLFGIELKVHKDKKTDAWLVQYKSKIISRYLNEFFGFPVGRKTYTVSEPEIIKKSGQNFRRAFALGAMTFEGSVEVSGRASMKVKSKDFRDSVSDIMKKDGLKVSDGFSCGKYTLSSNRAITKEDREKWSKYFEEGTTKWEKITINGDLKSIYDNPILNKIIDKISNVKIFDARWLYDELAKENVRIHFEHFGAYLDLLIKYGKIKKIKRTLFDDFSLDGIAESNVSVILPYDQAHEMFKDVESISSKSNIPKSTIYNWRASYWGIPLSKFYEILKIRKESINDYKGKIILVAQRGAYLYISNIHHSTSLN